MLNRGEKLFCYTMAIVAVAALYFTWKNNLAFLSSPSGDLNGFIDGIFANPAAASFSWDLLFLVAVVFVLMVQEARRWGVRFVWLYIGLSLLVAISVMFPLFLIARQLRIAGARQRVLAH